MRKRKLTKIIYISIICYIMLLSVGYALYNDSLTINGVASTVDFYETTMLPVSAVTTISDNEEEISAYHTVENLPSWLSFESESWNEDTYEINYKKNSNLINSSDIIETSISFSFTNPTVLNYTEGKTIVEIKENKNNIINEATASLSTDTVEPGNPVIVTLNIKLKPVVGNTNEQIKTTISYVFQGKLRTLFFVVNYKV